MGELLHMFLPDFILGSDRMPIGSRKWTKINSIYSKTCSQNVKKECDARVKIKGGQEMAAIMLKPIIFDECTHK